MMTLRFQGVRLIQVFENEWALNKEIVKSRIAAIFNVNQKIYARKCQMVEVDNAAKKRFLIENHLQGDAASSTNLGYFIMTKW